MKVLFHRILLAAFIVGLLILAGVFSFQKEKIFPSPIKAPLTSGEIIPSLTGVLEKSGLAVFGQPVVLGDSIIASVSGIRVIFTADRDFFPQVRALQLILGRLTIDKMPKEIDLRFDKVVIRY